MNYYNEFDPFAAKWLVELIKAGLIPNGEVDTRSIVDVRPADLRGFTQCHFFTGIGGWSHALRLAQWPDDKPIWTGSCPCQPLSVAGQGKGADDERHLWPAFYRLIAERKPAIVFGEQVASALGREWFAGVRLDLEGLGYACGAADLCAAGVGAPQVRQRLYWVGVGDNYAMRKLQPQGRICDERGWFGNASIGGDMGNANRPKRQTCDVFGSRAETRSECAAQPSLCVDMADIISDQKHEEQQRPSGDEREWGSNGIGGCGLDNRQNFWSDAEWRRGADGKARRVKPGVRLLADGVLNRVGKLRGYGNAIVPPLAAEVIKAFMETEIG